MTLKREKTQIVIQIIMTLFAVIIIYPMIMILLMSFKSDAEIVTSPLTIPSEFVFANYAEAWDSMNYLRVLGNSTFLTVCTVAIGTMIYSMAGYAVVRAKRGKIFFSCVFYMFLAGLVIPPQVTLVPLVVWLKALHLSNTFQGLIGVMIAGGTATGVFLIRNFISTIPQALEEAAVIDGCSPIGVFFRIIFPLLKPIVVTLVIMNSINVWNDFMHPLLLLQGAAARTVPLAVYFFKGEFTTQWNVLFAGLTLSIIPLLVVYFILQRHIMGGLMSGAVKS